MARPQCDTPLVQFAMDVFLGHHNVKIRQKQKNIATNNFFRKPAISFSPYSHNSVFLFFNFLT